MKFPEASIGQLGEGARGWEECIMKGAGGCLHRAVLPPVPV